MLYEVITQDGEWLFYKELHDLTSAEFTDRINRYNQAIANHMLAQAQAAGGPLLSYTDSYRTTRQNRTLVGIKSYPMSPFTEKADMDALLDCVYAAKQQVDKGGQL